MILNRAKKKTGKLLASFVLVSSLVVAGSAFASGTSTATIYQGSSAATGGTVTATGSSGKLTVFSSGPTFYVQGYAKKVVSLWPDSNAASAIAYSGQTVSKAFTATKSTGYYAKANTQSNTTSISGRATVTVN